MCSDRPCSLLIMHVAGAFGGAERTTENLLHQLDISRFYPVTVLASQFLQARLARYCQTFVIADELQLAGWFTDFTQFYHDVNQVATVLKKLRPRVVLGVMHYNAAVLAFAARYCHPRPTVIASFRGPAYEHIRRYESPLRRAFIIRSAITLTARLADAVLVPSQGTGEELVRHFWAHKSRIHCVPNGIDAAAIIHAAAQPVMDMPPLSSHTPLICVAARLSIEKDLYFLLQAFAYVRQTIPAQLWIIGDGPERQNLAQFIQRLDLTHAVTLLGYRDNVFPYLCRATVYVHTCQFEGFGYAILEALACGITVVAIDCPYGPREILQIGPCGLLTPPGNLFELAAAIIRVLQDVSLRAQLAHAARTRVADLTVARMVRNQEHVLWQAAQKGRS